MKKQQKNNDLLSQDMLSGASKYIKKKAFKNNSPIVIMEGDQLYLLDKNNKKIKIKNKRDNTEK